MITVPADVVGHTHSEVLARARAKATRDLSRGQDSIDVEIASKDATGAFLIDLRAAAEKAGDDDLRKDVEAILAARAGEFGVIRSRNALSEILIAYINHNAIDRWGYWDSPWGFQQPYIITDVIWQGTGYRIDVEPLLPLVDENSGAIPNGFSPLPGAFGAHFRPGRPETQLNRAGLRKETAALREAYEKHLEHARATLKVGSRVNINGKHFRQATEERGLSYKTRSFVTEVKHPIHCVSDGDASGLVMPEAFSVPPDMDSGAGAKPHALIAQVFDLGMSRTLTAFVGWLSQHRYRQDALESLVIPDEQRSVLDLVLGEAESSLFEEGDLIDGKNPGNIILCKGEPGIGKTLTAEAYAEHTKRPLYAVDLSALVSAGDLSSKLHDVMHRARRWNAIILLDEADVIVSRRGNDLTRNAITAEILRVVERYEQPLFLTTNRPDDIDDAVLSRCLLILSYEMPTGEASKAVWRALARSYKADIPDELIDQIVDEYNPIAPREIGQVIRLSKHRAAKEVTDIGVEHLSTAAAMRGATRRSA